MPRYVVPVVIRLEIEADGVREAFGKFCTWRKFVMAALREHLAEAGVRRITIPPAREYIEVDEAWLENDRLRRKFQQDWEYEAHEVPLLPGSKRMLTLKKATGPKADEGSV